MKREVVALLCLALTGCGGDEAAAPVAAPRPDGTLTVAVVNAPLAYFAERIGGGDVAVVFPPEDGTDPADWSPDPETVAAYQRADLVLRNGADYASWLDLATLDEDRIVDTSAGFPERLLPRDGDVTHSHGRRGPHSHAGVASHTWLDPTLALEQARAVADALAAARPARAADYRERFEVLASDLAALDARLLAWSERLGRAPILFSHPVYPYLARRYALNARSLHWEPDETPPASEWRRLEGLLAAHPAALMLWEAPPRPETSERLAAHGVRVAVYEPGGGPSRDADFLAAMRANVARLEQWESEAATPRAAPPR